MSNSDLVYEFASTGGGNEDGFNNPAMEYFIGNPSYYLARESLQNVLDAAIPGADPVVASFSSFDIKVHELPDYRKLDDVIKACNRYVIKADPDNPEAKGFYGNAGELFRGNPYINILKIEDFNTTGMYGNDDDPSSNYHKFMKSFGNSGKTTGSGGSFGFGKAAYYNASQLRMIFVSSIYDEDNERKYMFQGKLLLNSFKEGDDTKCGDGSFGFSHQKAVRDPELIPDMFRRGEKGTTVFIVGFCDPRGWQKNILHSVLENFWPAVCDGRLEVKIDNERIDDDSLERVMKREYSPGTPDKKDKPNPLPYFLAYTDEAAEITEKELDILGKIKLFTYIGPDLPNKTACARSTGMIVQKKGGYYCSKSHASFFYCENKKGSEILKRMENPRHDEWKAKNGPTISGKPDKELARAERELKDFIGEVHYKMGSLRKSESISILNIDRYLYSPADEEFNPGENSEGNGVITEGISEKETGSETGALENELKKLKTETKNKQLKPVIIPDRTIKVKEDEKGEINTWGGEGGPGNGSPAVPVTEDETGTERRVSIPINFRSFCPSGKEGIHILNLKNSDLGEGKIELEIFGVAERNGIIPLPLSGAFDSVDTALKTKRNKIYIQDNENAGTLKLKFKEHGKFSLLIEGYAYK